MKRAFSASEMKDSEANVYKPSIFWANAQTEYAKSVIFASEASVAVKSKQYIWAAIAGYYSLFHLSISLMYMVPTFVTQSKLTELIDSRYDGTADPTWRIKHSDIPDFLANCETRGLTPQLRKILRKAKELREFVNYRPHIEWKHEKLCFITREFSRNDVNRVIEALLPLLDESLLWAGNQGESAKLLAQVAAFSLPQFLEQHDLLYNEWCSPEVLAMAEEIRCNLNMGLRKTWCV